MAAEAGRFTLGEWSDLTPEQKLLRAIFGDDARPEQGSSKDAPTEIADDHALMKALDAISENLETNLARWDSELELIEEGLSQFAVQSRHLEDAAAQ